MDYNYNVNPGGYRQSSKEGWTEWPRGTCGLHGEYVFSFLKCMDYQEQRLPK